MCSSSGSAARRRSATGSSDCTRLSRSDTRHTRTTSRKTSGICGSGSVSLLKLSAAHRAAFRRRVANSALSRLRSRSTFTVFGLRCIIKMTARSSSVSARDRMVAIAFGAQVENRRGLCSPLISTLRMTWAAAFVCPELRIPRRSSLSFAKVSASSINSVKDAGAWSCNRTGDRMR